MSYQTDVSEKWSKTFIVFPFFFFLGTRRFRHNCSFVTRIKVLTYSLVFCCLFYKRKMSVTNFLALKSGSTLSILLVRIWLSSGKSLSHLLFDSELKWGKRSVFYWGHSKTLIITIAFIENFLHARHNFKLLISVMIQRRKDSLWIW